jgi:hypothetical protein
LVLLLDPYVDAVLLLALAFLIVGIMRSIAPFLARIPWVGGSIAGAAEGMARAIAHACGVAFGGIDHAIGVSFHAVAGFLGRSWGEMRSHAHAILQTATILGLVVATLHHLRALVHRIEGPLHTVLHRFVMIGRELHGIEHRIKTLERDLTKGIGHDLRTHVQGVERELHRIRSKVIPGIRSTAESAEAKAESALDWTRAHAYLPNVRTLEAAGAAILTTLGLNWLRCNSNPFHKNPNACGLWGDLAGLLGLVTTVLVAEDFEALVREMQALEGDAIGVAKDLFNVG